MACAASGACTWRGAGGASSPASCPWPVLGLSNARPHSPPAQGPPQPNLLPGGASPSQLSPHLSLRHINLLASGRLHPQGVPETGTLPLSHSYDCSLVPPAPPHPSWLWARRQQHSAPSHPAGPRSCPQRPPCALLPEWPGGGCCTPCTFSRSRCGLDSSKHQPWTSHPAPTAHTPTAHTPAPSLKQRPRKELPQPVSGQPRPVCCTGAWRPGALGSAEHTPSP